MTENGKPEWQLPPGIIEADTDPTTPRRRYRLTVTAHGDTLDDLLDALREIVQQWEEHSPNPQTSEWARLSGGPQSGHVLRVEQDPTVTRESYFAALDEWLTKRTEADA